MTTDASIESSTVVSTRVKVLAPTAEVQPLRVTVAGRTFYINVPLGYVRVGGHQTLTERMRHLTTPDSKNDPWDCVPVVLDHDGIPLEIRGLRYGEPYMWKVLDCREAV